jgi:molybdate transport system ATP-binding protein
MKRKSPVSRSLLGVNLAHIELVRAGRRILRDLHWNIAPGERWVLLGDNGAGKTQLLKMLAGDVWPQPGRQVRRVYTWGREQYTEPLGVREEIAYLGAERQDRYQHYQWNHRVLTVVGTGLQRTDIPLAPLRAAERGTLQALLRRCGIATLAQRRFLSLSYGERRLVLLARAMAWRPRMLLLDEPLNGLDAENRQRFLQSLRTLPGARLPWVYATHRLDEVPTGATHLAVLSGGRLRTQAWPAARRAATGARLSQAVLPAQSAAASYRSAALLRLVNAWVWRDGSAVLRGVSLKLGRGERLVVHGANGSGKSTLLGALYGEFAIATGAEVWRRGVSAGTPLYDFQRRVGRVSADLQSGLPRELTALETVVSGLRQCFEIDAAITPSERQRALRTLRRVGALGLAARQSGVLSYGQMRRVLFARALANDPEILLLDEPYSGLDAHTRGALQALVNSSGLRRTAIVMATHHRDEWPAVVTQELELADGEVRYCGSVRGAQVRRARVPRR